MTPRQHLHYTTLRRRARAARALCRAAHALATAEARPTVSAARRADSLNELNAEQARQPAGVILIFLVANILLTGLQFFWGSLIVKGIVKKIKGQKGE